MENISEQAQVLIRHLKLMPLAREGGFFASTYRSKATIKGRALGSAIYYLLCDAEFSHLHRLDADEVYHFYAGSPVRLLCLYPDGRSEHVLLGQDVLNGQQPQFAVPAGCWQGACLEGGGWALLGTTMTPGYEEAGYEHGRMDALIGRFPAQEKWIQRLCRSE